MTTIVSQIVSANEDGAIHQAVEQLIAGNLVALPTETVYGLAADALSNAAVQQIYATKGRPVGNPLICHVASIAMADRYVVVNSIAKKLMKKYWPGPLTLVLPQRENNAIPTTVSAGLQTLAVCCPASDITKSIIAELGRPIAAPSANASGKLSPTSAADVVESLGGKVPLILDGGETSIGIESTIIGIAGSNITLLRPGTVTIDDISDTTGLPVLDRDETQITAPGQLKSHYAPNAAVRLNATSKEPSETLIGFDEIAGDFTLSASGNLAEAAQNLFALLRKADAARTATIAVAPIPQFGIGLAINDRLKRAAAPRGL
ncbi:MAG: threonylcarbamoyl-AMP synthase [Kordiimonadaceae bacterium]|nr:threonylcarbamoyl-AMP synthase [Kordiimonadaceae bacterium]